MVLLLLHVDKSDDIHASNCPFYRLLTYLHGVLEAGCPLVLQLYNVKTVPCS
jgi:hypothetical protein